MAAATIHKHRRGASIAAGQSKKAPGTFDRVQRKPPENLAAYECVLAGKLLHHRSARADNEEALRMLDRAIALDPGYAHAHAWKACVLAQSVVYGWCANAEATQRTVIGEVTLLLDENDSDVHRVLAAVNLSLHHDHDKALYHQERALALNPNDDLIVVQQGEVLTWIGQPERSAIHHHAGAIRRWSTSIP